MTKDEEIAELKKRLASMTEWASSLESYPLGESEVVDRLQEKVDTLTRLLKERNEDLEVAIESLKCVLDRMLGRTPQE